MKTAESITPKHPDKVCDRISDTILEEYLKQDRNSRVAIETMGGHGKIFITGEVTTKAKLNIENLVKKIIPNFEGTIEINLFTQSPEISRGVDTGGAGDQGVMIGYACNENKEMIPQEFYLARNLCKFLYKKYPEDGKTQITINDNKEIVDIVVSFNNVKTVDLEMSIKDWLKNFKVNKNLKLHINPTGDWSIGSFDADSGLTGRKIVCDAYGPNIPVGGGAFSGKDPSKVDRSAAYMARKVAVDLLRKHDLFSCLVKVSYSIGIDEPTMLEVLGIDKEGKELRINVSKKIFKPKSIIKKLDLLNINYSKIAEWGSFGNGFIYDR